ncbi:MAG: hypothetical protein ACOY3E_00010 [Pseudomonadota bacterium]
MKTFITSVLLIGALAILGGVAFIYSGAYPVGADDRHTALTPAQYQILTARDSDSAQMMH